MLTEIQGDLFGTDIKIICQGCNTKGYMASGIAKEFHARYPKMFVEYQRLCRLGQYNLGDIHLYETLDGKRIIANLATQELPGPNASFDGIALSFQKLFKECLSKGYDIVATPRIGCGIGGLNWTDVKPLIQKISDQFGIKVVVYYL